MEFSEYKILIVGVGGLGCPAAAALAEAGVGTLGLMDPDTVEISNLHRQILYSDADIGRSKIEAALDYLGPLHPNTKLVGIPEALGAGNAERYLSEYDLIVDGLDRLEKKFFLNDWCVKLIKPFVHAGVVRFEGQVLGVLPGQTACLRCLIPKIPPPFAMLTCQEAGVLGAVSQTVGYLQAHEAFRLTQGKRNPRLWKIDTLKREVRSIVPQRNPECSACGRGKAQPEQVPGCPT